VRVFKNTRFTRFAKKEGITDNELREAVNQLEAGQPDADLGGGVYKIRIARPGEGIDAKTDLSLTDEQINDRLRKGTLIEVL
jgi:hypothetical protein